MANDDHDHDHGHGHTHGGDTISEYRTYEELSAIVDSLGGSTKHRMTQCLDNAVRSILLCHCGIDAGRYDDLVRGVVKAAEEGRVQEGVIRYLLVIAVAAGIVPRHTLDMVWDDDDLLMGMGPMLDKEKVMAALISVMAAHEPMLLRKMLETAREGARETGRERGRV